MEYLFMVSIGPVQSFIASARRTGDLQFGSWLLSELAKAAAKSIVNDCNSDINCLIFPAPKDLADLADTGTDLNVANKIVAIIDKLPQEVGDNVRKAVDKRLLAIKEQAFKGLGKIDYEVADLQINDLVECFWVAVPYNEQKRSYLDTRHDLESVMAARKSTRDFQAVTWGSKQPKSSIDGQLESVILEDIYFQRGDVKATYLYNNYLAGPAERLSGVDLLKRWGPSLTMRYPSTSHMATLPFLQRLSHLSDVARPQIQSTWNTYIKKLQEVAISKENLEQIPHTFPNSPILGKYEGSLLFEERLVDVIDVPSTDKSKLQEVKKALQAFYQDVDKALGKDRPSPYYAILLADGDRMGKVIDHFAEQGYEQHQQLSRKLDTFARGVRDIVKKHEGALVYSGGDDVLAFLPLHTVLQCAKELAEDFSEMLSAFQYEKDKSPSLSVGVAIVHHLHPLSDALNIARTAEKKAKDAGRNALAVTVNKRSGGEYTTAGHWNVIDGQLEKLIEYTGIIPSGTAYELQDMLKRLSFSTGNSMLQDPIQAETRRILQRKLKISEEKIRKESQDKAVQAYLNLLTMVGIPLPKLPENTVFSPTVALIDGKQPSERIEQLISMLLVARIFADAQKLARAKEQKNDSLDHRTA